MTVGGSRSLLKQAASNSRSATGREGVGLSAPAIRRVALRGERDIDRDGLRRGEVDRWQCGGSVEDVATARAAFAHIGSPICCSAAKLLGHRVQPVSSVTAERVTGGCHRPVRMLVG